MRAARAPREKGESMKSLEKKKVPELQALYAEHVGETTRSPNKTFLIRRIQEAMKAKGKKPKPTVAELQAAYEAAVGPPTGSTNVAYLKWKIAQAKAGRVRVGPPLERITGPVAILPFRVAKEAADALN